MTDASQVTRRAEETSARLVRMVNSTNGPSRKKILSGKTFVNMLELVQRGSPLAWCWSLSRIHGYGDAGQSTIAICFRRRKGNIAVGVGEGPAKRASPGRVWEELKPWRPDLASQVQKLEAWSRITRKDRVMIPASVFEHTILLLKQQESMRRFRQADYSGNGVRHV